MKKLLLVALFIFSLSSYAQIMPRPYLNVFSNNIQVQVYNNTDDDIRCSGFVYGRTQTGFTESHYYSDVIYKGMRSYRNFYIRNFNNRYLSGYHNIFCNSY